MKKIGLRSKTSKASSLATKIALHRQALALYPEYHENPLLKLLKSSKKEKQQTKTKAFNESLLKKFTFNLSGNVSKSTRRRRARKKRELLKPKMNDLLSSLPQETVNIVQDQKVEYVGQTAKSNSNEPNPLKQKGHKKLMLTERKWFTQVLSNQEFRRSPFAALKQVIDSNMNA